MEILTLPWHPQLNIASDVIDEVFVTKATFTMKFVSSPLMLHGEPISHGHLSDHSKNV
jgi:hypothetical protein